MRAITDIESEARDTLLLAALRLDRLSFEHREAKGYLTSKSVALSAQARALRDYAQITGPADSCEFCPDQGGGCGVCVGT